MLKKVSMIILMQKDIEQAVTFYKKLGLTLQFHLKGQWAELALGDIKIGLCPAAKEEVKRTGIVFEVDDLKSVYEKMSKDGVTFLDEPLEKVHGIMVSFKDPNGNLLDLYQPTPEKVRELALKAKTEGGPCCGASEECCKAKA